jgi:DNA gyrase/topoisomerase IV subunit B
MKQNIVKKISRRDKVLLRPNRFIGSILPYETERYIFNGDLFKKTKLSYSPGLIKIIREVIDNSIDESIRTNMQFANKIDIVVDKAFEGDWITVKDNGRGIPIIETEGDEADGSMMPEDAWCTLDAGANFDDEDDNTTMGQNGEGVSLTNIFSTDFIGSTWDGTKSFILTSKNNMESYDSVMGKSKKKGTEVKFLPDYERFGLTGFDETHEHVLMTDLINLSLTYPDVKFTYNKKLIKARNFKEYCKLFGIESYETSETNNLSIAVMPNNEDTFEFVHYINGLNVYNGGKPLDWTMRNIVNGIYEKLNKKHAGIKQGDIKNKLFAVAIFQNMVNPRFEDQIKSLCSNTLTEFKTSIEEPDWTKFCARILKNKEIIDPITDRYRIQEELNKQKELDGLEKPSKKRITSEKYTSAVGKVHTIVICEGKSAKSVISDVLGRNGIAYYELKGKPLNSKTASYAKFKANKELTDLYSIIKKEKTIKKVVIGADNDLDGIAICGLTALFFNEYIPEVLVSDMLYVLRTPIGASSSKNKITKWVYTIDEMSTLKGDVTYYKGLGTWEAKDLKHVIKTDGHEKLYEPLEFNKEEDEEAFTNWYSDTYADKRKEFIMANDFDLIKL